MTLHGLLTFLGNWSLFGFFLAAVMIRKPRTVREALTQGFICGPAIWTGVAIKLLITALKQRYKENFGEKNSNIIIKEYREDG